MEKKITFEKGMERLDAIASLLSSGEVSLEQSLDLFSEAVELLDYCSGRLSQARLQVETVMKKEEDADE